MSFLERHLEDPVRCARWQRWFYALLVAVAAAEILLPFSHAHSPHFWFERIPAWGSLYGLVSCMAIIVVSKFLGKVWLMRGEDYYDC